MCENRPVDEELVDTARDGATGRPAGGAVHLAKVELGTHFEPREAYLLPIGFEADRLTAGDLDAIAARAASDGYQRGREDGEEEREKIRATMRDVDARHRATIRELRLELEKRDAQLELLKAGGQLAGDRSDEYGPAGRVEVDASRFRHKLETAVEAAIEQAAAALMDAARRPLDRRADADDDAGGGAA